MPNGMRALALASMIVGFGATAVAAQSSANRADSAAVAGLEHQWLDHGDSATLERILAPDFEHALVSGRTIDKAEHIGFVARHPNPPSNTRRFERLEVRIYGIAAIATGVVAAQSDGSTSVRRTIFTDVFAKRGGTWQAVSAQEAAVLPPPHIPSH